MCLHMLINTYTGKHIRINNSSYIRIRYWKRCDNAKPPKGSSHNLLLNLLNPSLVSHMLPSMQHLMKAYVERQKMHRIKRGKASMSRSAAVSCLHWLYKWTPSPFISLLFLCSTDCQRVIKSLPAAKFRLWQGCAKVETHQWIVFFLCVIILLLGLEFSAWWSWKPIRLELPHMHPYAASTSCPFPAKVKKQTPKVPGPQRISLLKYIDLNIGIYIIYIQLYIYINITHIIYIYQIRCNLIIHPFHIFHHIPTSNQIITIGLDRWRFRLHRFHLHSLSLWRPQSPEDLILQRWLLTPKMFFKDYIHMITSFMFVGWSCANLFCG